MLLINSKAINVLRVYATILVFLCHSTIVAGEEFGYVVKDYLLMRVLFNTPAWGGVWIFLAIGGTLAALGFDVGKYSLDSKGIKKYYKGRFIKVLIPTWIFLSIAYIFNMQDSHVKFSTILLWLTCTFNGGTDAGIERVGASWYVFILMWIYLLAPLLFKGLCKFERKNVGKEFKSYLLLSCFIILLGMCYRMIGVILDKILFRDCQIYYNYFYANILGCVDIFFLGMIAERMLHYVPEISDFNIMKLKRCSICLMLITTILFLGQFRYLRVIYFFVGPCMFTLSTILIVLSYSYKVKINSLNVFRCQYFICWCNLVAPYTFMFYLWHSPILGYIAEKINVLNIYNNQIQFLVMLFLGAIITSYVAFLMTKMNNGVYKSLMKS